jgi:hypothetical protein
METCGTCKYWKPTKNKIGECDFIGSITQGNLTFDIDIFVHDDSGLYYDLITGENFGCIHHKKE